MTKKAKDDVPASERIDRYIAEIDDWRGPAIARVRELFHQADPEVVEEWKWMGSPCWSRHGLIAVANAHKGKVKVTFDKGARLADPAGLFNAGLDGNKWRAIDLGPHDRLDEAAFVELIRAAIAVNEAARRR